MADEQQDHAGHTPELPDASDAEGRDTMSVPPAAAPGAPKRSSAWRWVLGVVLMLLAGAGLFAWQANRLLFHPASFGKPEAVIVPRNARLRSIAEGLQERGLIPSAFALRAYARLTRKDNLLKAGEYELTGSMSPAQILELLNSGRVKAFWVTIPEGKWASEMSAYLAPRWPDAVEEFDMLVGQPDYWLARFPFLEGNTLEGYLFPNTYLVSKGAGAEQIIAIMLKAFEERCWKAYQANPPEDGRSFYEVLILASLVEAEAKVPSERATIAGVYTNRLRIKMKLQCDATVLYAHGRRLTRVLFRDLTINSPYNTYENYGLPIGPICNPGEDSFKAALQPAEVPYLYYVARGDGSHIFSRTGAEHEAARRKYLETLRQ
jgi:UPF0755 protein